VVVRVAGVGGADRDGDTVRLLAEMSAVFGLDRRYCRVECEVECDGRYVVTAFRQLFEDMSGARGASLGGDDNGNARTKEAVRMCRDYARNKIHDKGGDEVRIDRVLSADDNGDRVRLLAEISADYGRDRRRAQVECDVDFKGAHDVAVFRELSEKESRDLGGSLGRSQR
jgi:hypothetical protein